MFRSGNPTLGMNAFAPAYGGETMTLQGTINKCFVLFFLLLFSAAWVWGKVMQPAPVLEYDYGAAQQTVNVMPYVFGGAIIGFILAMVTIFKKEWAGKTAPLYALCEGLVLGGLSAYFETMYSGIVMQAVALTFGTMFCMLALYKSGVIKVTNKFIMGVTSATGAIFLVYMASWILSFFGVRMPFLYDASPIGIGISLLIVGIAAFNLILDFYIIEQGAEQGAPRYMEWYGAFALMVTLIWLYMEILRLLAKTRRR